MTISSTPPVRTPPPAPRSESNYKKTQGDFADLAKSQQVRDPAGERDAVSALRKDAPTPKQAPAPSTAARPPERSPEPAATATAKEAAPREPKNETHARSTAVSSHSEAAVARASHAYSGRPASKGTRINIRA
jgi:hypothetical protein